MARRYRSHDEAIAVRTDAARFAVAAALAEAEGDGPPISLDRMWAWCVYFEKWIAVGGDKTRQEMNIAPEESAPIVKLVKA